MPAFVATTPFNPGDFDAAGPYNEVLILAFEFAAPQKLIRVTYQRGNTVNGAWVPGKLPPEYLTLEGAAFDAAVAENYAAYANVATIIENTLKASGV